MDVVFTRWEEVVGAELGGHLRPLRVDGRALVVAADHPAWATRARMASADILSRVRALADTPVERLEVVVERALTGLSQNPPGTVQECRIAAPVG